MTLKQQILQSLTSSPNEYISGEELARRSDKSRAAVWKAIKSLKLDGYKIDAVTNKGYCLTDDNDILSDALIKSRLKHNIDVIYYPSIDSTNTQAKRLLCGDVNNTLLIVANEQTAGRGRQGKTFYSPASTGIYMTLVVHPGVDLGSAVTITTAAAVAVCKALEALTDKSPAIKWVNDVYIGDNKICGILTECISNIETGIADSVIIGIGMNINTVTFPEDIENAASLNAKVKRRNLIAAIADELLDIIGGGYDTFISYYRKHSMIIGKKINFIESSKIIPATATSIDESGGLVVKLTDGTQKTLRSGEISIRQR